MHVLRKIRVQHAFLSMQPDVAAVAHRFVVHPQPVHVAVADLQAHLRQHNGKGKACLTVRYGYLLVEYLTFGTEIVGECVVTDGRGKRVTATMSSRIFLICTLKHVVQYILMCII